MKDSVTVQAAARYFGVHRETIRRWIRAGAPCVEPGEVGRGRGSRLNVDDVFRWLAHRNGVATHSADEVMVRVETALFDTLRRDGGGDGRPIHLQLGVPSEKATALLTHACQRIQRALRGGG